MPSVHQLRPFAEAPLEAFRAASGPVALIQQPPDPVFQRVARQLGEGRTVVMAHRTRLVERLLAMLQGFHHLEVHLLQPRRDGEVFTVGRLDTCVLVVPDPSVSKLHAMLRWNAKENRCTVVDAGSMNGTFVNAVPLGAQQELTLNDGDALAFGDSQFLYVHIETLHAHLRLLQDPS
ncbi:FHA domain-containing protein [Stigmatella aurantiaca]|uniref:FHA domain-containing protein n=1 Tax=Stigmatella aurantiaca TaxID=41 RepID=A0A1H7P4C4_STIAU|nr:FHA domain-containing protein [Stigmatella aurantiaca]SEL30449.1 FHA domain-containing protein [Stigmatella aurantiaca]